jgi:radical SAM family uncharacterized protein/radical SAM-linked protein
MSNPTLKDFLPLVAGPSRYLGSEVNSVHKDPRLVRLRFALAFPDRYDIGMSHFGMQILYHILNRDERIAAERVFAPDLDMGTHLAASGTPLCSLETGTSLQNFDIIGFSLLYELNYTNILMMLDLSGIPFRSALRDSSHPLLIAGGPCTVNPEPVADFFDAMVIGDGETVVMQMAEAWMTWREGGGRGRKDLLRTWADIEGVYVPAFFSVHYDASGFQRTRPVISGYEKVTRAVMPELNTADFPDRPVVAFGRPVHDRLRLEIARGCSRGCRFCQAGMIYRPVRERSVAEIMYLAEQAIAATGYDDISVLSLSTGDYGCLAPLMQELMEWVSSRRIAVSIPSFRAGTLTPALMEQIRRVRKTGFTIAPEAGSERLRAVINKNISEQDVTDTVRNAFSLGWRVIKLYFMIGLPTETDADIEAIADLVGRIRNSPTKGGRAATIHASVATFIPKPHVPFQWDPQITLAQSKDRIERLRSRLRMRGVTFKWQKPETSLLEGLFARGDRRLALLLETAWKKGCRFDGWSDTFNFRLWEEALAESGIDIDFFTTRRRRFDEPLPWDHIDTRVSRNFLLAEREKAERSETTTDCHDGECQACGVCDMDRIMPRCTQASATASMTASDRPFWDQSPASAGQSGSDSPASTGQQDATTLFYARLAYSRRKSARYFGHLELVTIFSRAIRRAGIPVVFSKGFHPKPRMSFHNPLPVGMESESEICYIILSENVDCRDMITQLNRQLPTGVFVHNCRILPPGQRPKFVIPETAAYRVTIEGSAFNPDIIAKFHQSEEWQFDRTSHKGDIRRFNLKDVVADMDRIADNILALRLRTTDGKILRPDDILRTVFQFSEDQIRRAVIIKLFEIKP